MSTRRVEFEGARGQRLAGRLELPPDGVPRATALFAQVAAVEEYLDQLNEKMDRIPRREHALASSAMEGRAEFL